MKTFFRQNGHAGSVWSEYIPASTFLTITILLLLLQLKIQHVRKQYLSKYRKEIPCFCANLLSAQQFRIWGSWSSYYVARLKICKIDPISISLKRLTEGPWLAILSTLNTSTLELREFEFEFKPDGDNMSETVVRCPFVLSWECDAPGRQFILRFFWQKYEIFCPSTRFWLSSGKDMPSRCVANLYTATRLFFLLIRN